VLRQAGFDPVVVPADVDETLPSEDVSVCVLDLAYRKAHAVAPDHPDDVVLGCDSLVTLDGRILGKPSSAEEARSWWQALSGGSITVWTGHTMTWAGRGLTQTSLTTAYVATGEPLGVAGAFRLDGRAAAFVESMNGEPGTVHGVSVPQVRDMLRELDLELSLLWA
jgi:septum formation protein